jgi:hypothetical protein
MSDGERFQIRSPEGAVYELRDPAFFLDEYEPKGYEIVTDPPAGHIVPDLRELRAERKAKAKAEAEKQAEREAAAKKREEDAAKAKSEKKD